MSSTRDSPPPMGPPEEKVVKCWMHFPDRSTVVAKGRAFVPLNGYKYMLHCVPLGSDVLKVIIDVSEDGKAKLPIPTDELFEECGQSSKRKRDKGHQPMDGKKRSRIQARKLAMDKCKKLISSEDDFVFRMNMPKDLVHHTHSVDVLKEHIVEWCSRDELEANQISMYIRYLSEKFKPSLYRFLCPYRVGYLAKSDADLKQDDRPRYMAFAMGLSSGMKEIIGC